MSARTDCVRGQIHDPAPLLAKVRLEFECQRAQVFSGRRASRADLMSFPISIWTHSIKDSFVDDSTATSSTSKVVLVSRSGRDDCNVDCRFGQVIDRLVNANAQIIAHAPLKDSQSGGGRGFELEGVAFPAAQIKLEFP